MANVLAGVQVLPNGKDMDTHGIIPKIVDVVKHSGLPYQVGPMETVIEGNIDEVFALIKKVQQVGIDTGANEVITNVKVHYRPQGIRIEDKQED